MAPTANQRSTSLHKQGRKSPSKSVADKLAKKVSDVLTLAKSIYPHRYIRVEPTPNVVQGPDIEEHVYELWTCPKQSELPADGWQLIQRGLLDTLRRYCQHEASNQYVRHDQVAEQCGTNI